MRRHLDHFKISITVLILAVCIFAVPAAADEVVIQDGGSERNVTLGDYSCSPCFSKLASALEFRSDTDPSSIEMTTGELWQFFDSQGHQSVSTLTLFVDVDQIGLTDSFNLSKLDIQIQSPDGRLATDTKLGGNQLVLPGSVTSGNRPEAELQFDLGYDFMQLFSSDSTEVVRVSIDSPIGAAATVPRFHLSANESVWGETSLSTMFLFVLFWGSVFLALLKWMRPVRKIAGSVGAQQSASV